MPRASRAPTHVKTTAPAAPAAATRLSMRVCWLYLRTAIVMAGNTMISAVPCASCCDIPISSTSAGMAMSPPPMPSTPPMKPIRPPSARHAAITNRLTEVQQAPVRHPPAQGINATCPARRPTGPPPRSPALRWAGGAR
ncbi:hypothetical protein G6F65_022428 [Rhizopus arrhizus]|nr:hypothetical protein G6F65_022428 [Rhizopus arrhizus]